MKFTIKAELEGATIPELEHKLRKLLTELADWENDTLRAEVENLNGQSVEGYAQNFQYRVES